MSIVHFVSEYLAYVGAEIVFSSVMTQLVDSDPYLEPFKGAIQARFGTFTLETNCV